MHNFFIALNAVSPLFLLILLGRLSVKTGVIGESCLKELNTLVYKVFTPALLFTKIYGCDFKNLKMGRMFVFCAVMMIIIVAVLWCASLIFEKDRKKCAVGVQSMFRSNYLIVGLPILYALYPSEDLLSANLLAAVSSQMFTFLAVLLFEINNSETRNIREILKHLFVNPIVIACIVSVVFSALKIPLPQAVTTTVNNLGSAMSPVALLIIGGSLHANALLKERTRIGIYSLVKLVVVPIIALFAAISSGFRGVELMIITLLFASPSSVSCAVFTRQYGGDVNLSAGTAMLTAICSCVTLVLWITVLLHFWGV